MKASQGRTKTRLLLDPGRAPAVAAIFTWRTEDRLGAHAITCRLEARPDLYPPPGKAGRWTEASVHAILANPKYTGHMVFGRKRPATRRTYTLRSRVRCRSCTKRMHGMVRTSPRYWNDGPDYSNPLQPVSGTRIKD
jgi:Recombinase